ncbi:MAG: hypothetical protein NC343_08475 [Muribaculum sp.]|nr:hypothetical protein [Muribaculaceae bacterium]MCM1081770.1 hypothetical protein [Muribaculum sp.]
MPHPIQTIKKLFRLDAEQLSAIEQLLVEQKFSKGDIIDSEHSLHTQVYYLKRGAARVFHITKGKDNTIQFAFDDEFLDTRPNSVGTNMVMFMEDSEVVYMPKAGMRNLFSDREPELNPEAIMFLNASLIDRVKNLEERVFYTQHATAVERYNWVINRYPRLLECATITQIASFLGLTKETLYRIRSGKY